jgi:ABC-type Fe3+/spermidine/putrescine transport system ATPase subunit
MNRGVVEQVDVPESVYERPATTFVAGFIGVSNLMPGDVVSANGVGTELKLDAGVTVRTESADCDVGERAHAVVRPEKLELHPLDGGVPTDRPSVEGIIESSLYLGTATQVVVKLADGTAMTVLVPNTDEAARQRMPGAGARVRLAWANEHIHMVRDAEGGEGAPTPQDTAEVA